MRRTSGSPPKPGPPGHTNAASTSYWSIANRASFLLDFSGPSLVVDTACSASLTAIHLACESLRRGECGAAPAGGVNLILHPRQFVNLSQAHMVSRGAECRAFGAGADGFVDGEGVGAVLEATVGCRARRRPDRGRHPRQRGQHRGALRLHGAAPKAQARVIGAALRRAGVAPETISTSRRMVPARRGDPIEIAGLAERLGGAGVGAASSRALKANIGHLESAAGVAGLTKVLLQLRHRTIAPSRHAGAPNPLIDPRRRCSCCRSSRWCGSPRCRASGRGRRQLVRPRATRIWWSRNTWRRHGTTPSRRPTSCCFSARDPDQLRIVVEQLLAFLRTMPVPLGDLAQTLRVGREAMAARLSVMADTAIDLTAKLTAWLEGWSAPGVSAAATAGTTARMPSETEEGRRSWPA